jgi:hypothetical protein
VAPPPPKSPPPPELPKSPPLLELPKSLLVLEDLLCSRAELLGKIRHEALTLRKVGSGEGG